MNLHFGPCRRFALGGMGAGIAFCFIAPTGRLVAQTTAPLMQLADRGPAFYQASGGRAVTVDVRAITFLQAILAVDLSDTPLADAIDSIASRARVRIIYNSADVPTGRRVTLSASRITLAAALRVLLDDTALDVHIASEGTLSLTRRSVDSVGRTAHVVAVVQGVVTDASTHAPLAQAVVRVEGKGQQSITGQDGSYRIAGLTPGTYALSARRLGYTPLRRTIVLGSDSVYRLDLPLIASPAMLDQVVTTVTGDRSVQELGHMPGIIKVDSVVQTAPVTNLTDIITARVPGVQVNLSSGGLTGASPPITIRGENSLSLSNEPLIYVDGIRQDNSTVGDFQGLSAIGESSGRFNDIVPEDIESIEIVKGPSASALYGTDAANGIIAIRTKRGVAGARRFSVFAEQGLLVLNKSEFPYSYTGWGRLLDGSNATTDQCTLVAVAARACVQDSITHFSPFRDPATTPITNGERGDYGLQLSGGTDTRYFVSGTYQYETGVLKLPTADMRLYAPIVGATGFGNDALHPNALSKYSVRDNVITNVGSIGDVSLLGSYLSSDTRIPLSYGLAGGFWGPGYRDSVNDGWAYGARPAEVFVPRHDEAVQRFDGSVNSNWHPTTWFSGRGIVGVEFSSNSLNALGLPDEAAPGDPGYRVNARTNTTMYTVDLGASAEATPLRFLKARTSIGVQYNRTNELYTGAGANNLTAGCQTVACGTFQNSAESSVESVVAGSYGEEAVSIGDWLFLTGAIRVDGATAFGSEFATAYYPKASASWVISQAPFWPHQNFISLVRLRSAWGESGVQPPAAAGIATINAGPVYADGALTTGVTFGLPGNPALKPERQREFEAGADVSLASSRIDFGFTYYSKRSSDALVSVVLPVSQTGVSTAQLRNVGAIANWGYEGNVSLQIIKSASTSFSVNVNGSINHNQLLTLGSYGAPNYGSYGTPGVVRGFPIFSWFSLPISNVRDANGNGIIEPGEFTQATTYRYVGPSYPQSQFTTTPVLSVLKGTLSLSASFDYRGAFVLENQELGEACALGHCLAAVDRRSSFASQASAVAIQGNQTLSYAGYFQDGSFTKLRELALTYRVPTSWARVFKSRSASVTLSARNVATWTRYTGADPEESSVLGNSSTGPFFDYGALPPPQYWILRFNLGM